MGRASVRSSSYDELFGEKLRALVERTRPRDLYDVVNMFWFEPERPQSTAVVDTYQAKCRFKGDRGHARAAIAARIGRC
jgi:predicted nucleotidyltransferase component of viral defense system